MMIDGKAWKFSAGSGLLLVAACASAPKEGAGPAPEPQWAANGWLTPGRASDPEIIGLYARRSECETALADWLASQVVGNPVEGECLPIDTR